MRGPRRGLTATVVAVVFVTSGLSLIGVSIASQRQASAPHTAIPTPAPSVAMIAAEPESQLSTTVPVPRPPHVPPAPALVTTLPSSKPVTLDIPSIDVHSVIQHLGQAADGALEVPAPGPHYDEAAWYRHSPTPGSLGPAIVYGHIDSAADGPSVFFRLGELRSGDHVRITRADGSIAVFEVDEVHSYAKDNFPTEVVYGDIDHAGLRILTCGGAFDDSTGHYLDNIVVFASLVS